MDAQCPTWKSEDGSVMLWLGDNREILPALPKCDAAVTDPPYGIGIAANPVRQKHERNDWDNAPASREQIDATIAASGKQIIWGGNYFHLPPRQGFLVWDKVQPEDFTLAQVEQAWLSENQPAKLFRRHVVSYRKFHPTQKPVELMEWCLGFVPDATTILDNFMGVGTTGIACVRRGKRFVGIEKHPPFFWKAVELITAELNRSPLFDKPPVLQNELFT